MCVLLSPEASFTSKLCNYYWSRVEADLGPFCGLFRSLRCRQAMHCGCEYTDAGCCYAVHRASCWTMAVLHWLPQWLSWKPGPAFKRKLYIEEGSRVIESGRKTKQEEKLSFHVRLRFESTTLRSFIDTLVFFIALQSTSQLHNWSYKVACSYMIS